MHVQPITAKKHRRTIVKAPGGGWMPYWGHPAERCYFRPSKAYQAEVAARPRMTDEELNELLGDVLGDLRAKH